MIDVGTMDSLCHYVKEIYRVVFVAVAVVVGERNYAGCSFGSFHFDAVAVDIDFLDTSSVLVTAVARSEGESGNVSEVEKHCAADIVVDVGRNCVSEDAFFVVVVSVKSCVVVVVAFFHVLRML